jgi:hypothetical protein
LDVLRELLGNEASHWEKWNWEQEREESICKGGMVDGDFYPPSKPFTYSVLCG